LQQSEQVVVEVGHLSLDDDAAIMKNPDVKRLFIAYNLLGVNPAELETPISLPKPKSSNHQITFNFRKGQFTSASNLE